MMMKLQFPAFYHPVIPIHAFYPEIVNNNKRY